MYKRQADTVVLDKTGTITVGKPSVTDVLECVPGQLLPVAAALEKKSGHPLADAIVRYAANTATVEVNEFTDVSGKGIRGKIDGRSCFGGSYAYMEELGVDLSACLLYTSRNRIRRCRARRRRDDAADD